MEMAQITALIGAAASLLCTLVVGALTYFVKQTLNDFRKADERNAQKLAEVDKRHAANYKELTQQISDLKSDLPLVYVLREDFIRSMNNVDGKLDKIIGSLADKKGGYGMEGEKTVVDELKLVQISKRSNSVTQGDKSVKVSLDLAIYGGIVQDGVEPI